MSLLQRLRASLARLMAGRHGADEFSLALLIAGLVLSMLASFTRLGLLSLIGMALYILSIFRIFSRNHAKRGEENRKYLEVWNKCTGGIRQFFVRLKNARRYKYFKCPECHARLRLPRKVGEVTVTCGKCRHAFRQKA